MLYTRKLQSAIQSGGHRFFLFSVITSICLFSDPVVVSGGPENDYESWIIRTSDNRLRVIFCRNPDWQSGDLYVTFSTDNGVSWDATAAIIESPGDQATLSFLQLPGDTFRLWYASNEGNTYGIYTAHSFDGTNWNRDGPVDLGWGPYDNHYDPTVIIEPDSSLTMSYRGPAGAYVAHKPYDDKWDTLRTLVGSSGFRPRIMKHSDGTYLYSYHRNTPSGYEVFVRTSNDRVDWAPELRLTFHGNSHDPFPNETTDGAYLVYYATHIPPAYNLYRCRSYDAVNWEAEEQLTFDPTNNTQPHFFVEANQIFLVWAHAILFPDDHDVYFERSYYTGVNETKKLLKINISRTIEIHPIPCSKKIQVAIPTGMGDVVEFLIYDIQGRAIKKSTYVQRTENNTYAIETVNLKPGVFFLRINCANGNYYKRFVVVR
ncbi:MAG: T9SS type A sorting domain-containing protein [bacterium]